MNNAQSISDKSHIDKLNSILDKGKPPFDYGKILLKNYNFHLSSYFNEQNFPPYEIEIQPSSKCNANCTHCWAKDFDKLEDKLEKKENANLVIEQILGFNQNGFPLSKIKFCGSTGDPLMNPIIEYFIDRFDKKREMRLFTNGIKIGQEKNNYKYLDSLSKLNSIYLSLDAGTTDTLWRIKPGAQARRIGVEDILEGARRIKEIGDTKINLSYVITKDNYMDIKEATTKAKKFKADLIRFRIDLTDRNLSRYKGKEIIEELNQAKNLEEENFRVIPIHSDEEIKETDSKYFGSKGYGLKCYTNLFWTCIGSNGKVYPCGHIVSPETEEYGDLFKEDFKKIWQGEKTKEVRKNLPGKLCDICSPFSLTTNMVMNEISSLQKENLFNFLGRYSK